MKLKYCFFIALAAVLLGACNKFNDTYDGLLNSPNSPTPASADADLYLNQVQLNFKNVYSGLSDFGAQVTRMQYMGGPTYYNAYGPTSFDGVWTTAYTTLLKNTDAMIPLAEGKKLYLHAGIGKILKAYTFISMVDFFGDVPYSEANQGAANISPKVDKGQAVYDSALALLDAAIVELKLTPAAKPSNDLFYNGSAANWITLAKTIQLKAYVQTRLVNTAAKDKISALLAENNLINSASQDFVFQFGTKNQAPDSRDPHFVDNYGVAGQGAGDYMGTYYLWDLYQSKSMEDPRIRYYFYRQSVDVLTDIGPSLTARQFAIPCYYRPSPYPSGTAYCLVGTGYLGRDHANNEGIPPDNTYRTTWGVYPAGGAFDEGTGGTTAPGLGGKGAGIYPIWLSAFTSFLKAEAALTLGTTGDPEALTEAGIKASFAKVLAFPGSIGVTVPNALVPTATDQDNYLKIVRNLYNNASSTDAKLNIIMSEYYLSLWGNGIEPYNNYRRTGKPDNLQPPLQAAGDFIRSFFYPAVFANFNKNVTQKTTTLVKVFWDNNPDNFVH